jgi:hypothetical protein
MYKRLAMKIMWIHFEKMIHEETQNNWINQYFEYLYNSLFWCPHYSVDVHLAVVSNFPFTKESCQIAEDMLSS